MGLGVGNFYIKTLLMTELTYNNMLSKPLTLSNRSLGHVVKTVSCDNANLKSFQKTADMLQTIIDKTAL